MESVTTEVMRLSGLTVQIDLLAMMILRRVRPACAVSVSSRPPGLLP
jgi:hypothetical protein